jgi:hypothetical protein
LDIVTSFTDDNLTAASTRKVNLASIPVEAFWSIPKNAFAEFGEFDFSERLNFTALTTGAYTDAYIELEASGFTFDWSGTGNITYTSTSEPIGYAKWVGNNDFTDYEDFSGDLYLDTSSPWDFLDTLPDNVEFIAKNVARMGDGSALHMITYKPGAAYAGFRPMTDDTYDGYTFIDNLGFNGEVYFSAYITFDPAVGTPASGTNNQFIGFIKRSAMGKTAGDLLDSDIVCGLISQGTAGRLVVNGSVVESWTHSFERGNREFALSFYPQFDLSEATAAQLNELPMTFDGAYMQGYDAAGDSDPYVDYSGDFTVDMSEAVIAAINDADLEGIGGSWTGYDHGSFESTCFLETVYYGEMAKGYVYFSDEEGVHGDLVQTIDINVTYPFGHLVQTIDINVTHPFGDMVRPVDIDVRAPWSVDNRRMIQPISIIVSNHGDMVQPVDIDVTAPHGDMVQPIDILVTSSGDMVQPIDISVRDPSARTMRCKIRTYVGGEDISDRTLGEGNAGGEEGGAVLATITLAPEVGEIDAEAMSGLPVVVDALIYSGSSYAACRLFTGKVEKPVWNPSRGTLELSCTDDLQNKIAGLSREALQTITGGRHHLAVQGEQKNNFEYARALMETVAGSLDADPYGALRVTHWHTDEVWKTYTLANTEQDSIDFTLADNTGIVNQITGTFEYRFTRLHRRTASMEFMGDMIKTVRYGLPLLTRTTVESALQGTGWNFYFGQSSIMGSGGGGETPRMVTDGQPATPNITYTPYPEVYDLPGGGVWYQKETNTTCLGFSCSMWRRWAQTVTETYVLKVKAPESIAVNGLRAREDRASLTSEWDASPWESDPDAQPSLPLGGLHATLDYSPDASTDDRDTAISIFLDTLKVEVDASHRSGRARGRTWLTPELDRTKRVRIESPRGEAEGKVFSYQHSWDMNRGRFTTDFEIAVSRHGGVGITPPADTPSEAPAAPAVPEVSTAVLDTLYDVPGLYIGALASSPEEDENWTGWIVNVPPSFNVNDPGSDVPRINPETQKTERQRVNDPYSGSTSNPLYRADKEYKQTGFRVKLPAVEEEMRDAAAPVVKTEYTIPIVQDDFTLTA